MHTPFEILRNKEKNRKARISSSQSPPIVVFSLQNSRNESPELEYTSKKKGKSSSYGISQLKTNSKAIKNQQQQNYQIIVKNTLKKMSLFKLTSKKYHQKSQEISAPHLSSKPSQRKLIVEGSPCKDLIKLNKKKLEYMISKIKEKTSPECPPKVQIPEVMISKCQIEISQPAKPKKSRHFFIHQNNFISNIIKKEENEFKWKEMMPQSFLSQSRKEQSESRLQFDPKQYLICSQIKNKQKYETNLEFVLNNKNIVDYIKESKKRKQNFYEQEKIKEISIKNSKNQYIFYAKTQRKNECKTCKTQQVKRQHVTSQTQRKKVSKSPGAVFNGVSFDILRGWQSKSQTIDDLFIAQSYLN